MRVAVIGLRGVPNVIGGVEAHCERLYPDLVRQAPELDFWLLARSRYVSERRFAFRGVEVVGLWAPHGVAIEAAIHTLIAIVFAKGALKADLVHLHGIGPAFFSPLARMLGMKVVVTHHAADFDRPKWGRFAQAFLRIGEAITARAAHRVVCVSEALRREFLDRHPAATSRTHTIRHGAPLFPTDPETERSILAELGVEPGQYNLAVGRLDETKGFHDLVDAMTEVGARALPLIIVGSAVEETEYAQNLVARSGAKVIFAGYRCGAELGALYRRAALFIHPSSMEGFALVVLEALSADIPIRLSDIPAHREFGLPEGAYFKVGDQARIRQIFVNAGRDVAIDNKAIRQHYSAESNVLAHAALFRDLAAARR